MATFTKLFPKEPKQATAIFAMKYEELLKRSQRQAAVAREMSDKARQMIEDAIEMRERLNRFVVR